MLSFNIFQVTVKKQKTAWRFFPDFKKRICVTKLNLIKHFPITVVFWGIFQNVGLRSVWHVVQIVKPFEVNL